MFLPLLPMLVPAVIILKHYPGNYLVQALALDSFTTLAISTCPKKRTQYEIIWNCLTTIVICTWVSIHPNIPPPHKGHLGVFWRRIKLMLWSLIVPELILGWAFRQWIAAREIEREFKGRGWTRLHGHFLIMGGFSLVNRFSGSEGIMSPLTEIPRIPDFPPVPQNEEERKCYRTTMEGLLEDIEAYKRYTYSMLAKHNPGIDRDSHNLTNDDLEYYRNYELGLQLRSNILYLRESSGSLSFRRFKDLIHNSRINFPSITAAEICDKSKGDFLSKTIAILQTTWFIVQCLARHEQGLAITELELITLALASLNGLIYVFWWNKPLGVYVPVPVYLRGSEFVAGGNDHHNESVVAIFFGKDFKEFINTINFGEHLNTLCRQTGSSITSFLQVRRKEIRNHSSSRLLFLWFFHHPFLWFLYNPISAVVKSLYAIINTDTMEPGATHVPTFYATCFDWHTDMILTYFVLPFIAVIFGGLHCLGWNLFFPTRAERILWRSASVFITFIPFVILPFWKYKSRVAMYPALALLSLYVFARLALLIEAVVTLRMQPETAYFAVDWSKFLPHVS